MGKIAIAIDGLMFSHVKKQELLALDVQFHELESQVEILKTENSALKDQNKTLQEQVSAFQQGNERIKQGESHSDGRMDKAVEQCLIAVAQSDATRERIIRTLSLSKARGEHYFDVLVSKKYIIHAYANSEGMGYRATPAGREYLIRHDLIE